MIHKTDLPAGFKLAEDLEVGDVIDIAANHYRIATKNTNAFKEINLWLEMTSLHALYEDHSTNFKATLTIAPTTIVKIHE